jgi:hypothetical protein
MINHFSGIENEIKGSTGDVSWNLDILSQHIKDKFTHVRWSQVVENFDVPQNDISKDMTQYRFNGGQSMKNFMRIS